MTKKITSTLVLLTLSSSVWAKNQLIQVWENEVVFNNETIGQNPGWNHQVLVKSPKKKATKGPDWNVVFSQLKEQLKNGELKSGESVILNFYAFPTKVTVENAGFNIDEQYYGRIANAKQNIASLIEVIELSEKAGVKLGIIDLSPYSEHTESLLKHAKKNTCIIGNKKDLYHLPVASGNFGRAFSSQLGKPGMSLEDIFLSSSAVSESYEGPYISSKNHEFAKEQIALVSEEKKGIKLTESNAKSKLRQLAREDDGECAINNTFDSLIKDVQKIQGQNSNLKFVDTKSQYLRSLEKYRKMQLDLYNKYIEIGGKEKKGQLVFESNIKNPQTGKALISEKVDASVFRNGDSGLAAMILLKQSGKLKSSVEQEAVQEIAEKIRAEQQATNKKMLDFTKNERKLMKDMDKQMDRQYAEVFALSKKFYQELYQSQQDSKSACSEIKF